MMTAAGWIFMALFWGFILIVTVWCFWIVLFEKQGFGDANPQDGHKEGTKMPPPGRDPGPSTGLPVPPTP